MKFCNNVHLLLLVASPFGIMGQVCDPVTAGCHHNRGLRHEEPTKSRQLGPEFNTLPSGGWSTVANVHNGYEWIYGSRCAPTATYYAVFPEQDIGVTAPSWCSTDNFPDCVRYSGFSLPTEEMKANRPAPATWEHCTLHYSDAGQFSGPDQCFRDTDYARGFIAASDWTTRINRVSDTVYVRPVGTPDSCCPDNDFDGICNDIDNCPDDSNPDQADLDADGLGDACDACPNDPLNDVDGDEVCGDVDNCPFEPNLDQSDVDDDGLGDVCDPCPLDFSNDADGNGKCGCKNDAAYAGTDSGCDGNAPICVDSNRLEPPFHVGGVSCNPCVNTQQSPLWPDLGCPGDKPLCLTSDNAEPDLSKAGTHCAANDFVCFNSHPFGEQDKDCPAGAPICVGEDGKEIDSWCYGAECVPCVNSFASPAVIDFGCSEDAPRCADDFGADPLLTKPGSQCVGEN